ncbi:TPA: manganese catalase family protein [Klebsiella quasipneumoniae subsp. quasipneumoniae]|nr:manganese catalase family protein [Klebsiella quasipneumoniae subsp. quasipneumoniae]HBR1956502.1 manganese catalase family protein [Klebsiella quasipneumoniae subsp. quasipneumoniae]
MFRHVKQLQYTVRVAEPNPGLANLLLEQFGGPQGELAAACRYFTQGLSDDDPGVKDALAFLMTREAAHQLSFEKALQSIRNNYPPGKLPPISEYANTYYNMSEGGEVRGSWNSDKHFDYVQDPQPAVDGGDGSASVGLTPEQEALCKAMLKRTESDPQGDPLTGAELGAGKQNTSSSAK